MRSWTFALLLLGALAGAAGAQAPPGAPPGFSPAEQKVIARNALLRSAVQSDPALVRRALDALAKLDEGQMRAGGMIESGKTAQPKRTTTPNPDLDRLERASPEALDDLFQLLKQAGRTKSGTKK